MHTQQIDCFLSVARHLGFTKAAEELYLSQPTISRHIAQLEEELGFPLFVRSKKGIVLTPGGRVMVEELGRVKTQMLEATRRAGRANLGLEGKISIGCLTGTNTSLFITPPTKRFTQLHPKMEVTLEKASFGRLRSGLEEGVYDIIFTLDFELPSLTDIHHELAYPATTVILMSRRHPLADKPGTALLDFKDETFIQLHADDSHGRATDVLRILRPSGFTSIQCKYASNLDTVYMWTQMGLGVCICDTSMECVFQECYSFYPIPQQDASLNVIMAFQRKNQNPAIPLYLDVWNSHSEEIDVFFY